MKKTTKRMLTASAFSLLVGGTLVTTAAKADTVIPYNPSTSYNRYGHVDDDVAGRVYNRTTDGDILTYLDNFELYNFQGEEVDKSDGAIYRYWQPKSEASVINDKNSFSYDNSGRIVYNFDSYGYQLSEGTNFGSKTYIGELSGPNGTIYRYWK